LVFMRLWPCETENFLVVNKPREIEILETEIL
jgi:hypothetical protein